MIVRPDKGRCSRSCPRIPTRQGASKAAAWTLASAGVVATLLGGFGAGILVTLLILITSMDLRPAHEEAR